MGRAICPPLLKRQFMAIVTDSVQKGTLKGAVYGDMVGAPYMIENTYDRYFDIGESRKAYSYGKVRTFFPSTTEVSLGCGAVCSWLTSHRESPTIENLQKCLKEEYHRHPKGGWTQPTRLSLLSDTPVSSQTSDWGSVARVLPISAYVKDDLNQLLELSEACVRATCSCEEAVSMGKAISHAAYMALKGNTLSEIKRMMIETYSLGIDKSDEDLRAELRGEKKVPLEMMGQVIEGAYRYVMTESPQEVSSKTISEAALKAVLSSDSWEDAVRKAVSYGGPSNAVAGIAGGLAEAVYGEVTPRIVGRLFTNLSVDLSKTIEAFDKREFVNIDKGVPVYHSLSRDSVTIIGLGPGNTVYVVPEERKDIRRLLHGTFPSAKIITPDAMLTYLSSINDNRTGTRPFGIIPEVRTLYVQDSKALVSPSTYIAAGMPPLQIRERHRKEFLSFRAWCISKQQEMNRFAGNPENCQIHYEGAYHMWVGSRRIDFYMGDQLAGRVKLDDKGLLRLELGEYRDLSQDARFENHAKQSWESRSLFTTAQTVDPITNMDGIKDSIMSRLLDEGGSSEQISNLDRLEKLDDDQIQTAVLMDSGVNYTALHNPEPPLETGAKQAVKTIFSIGYGRRSEENFINTIQMLGVDTVVDIRSNPNSKIVPHFNEDRIYPHLKDIGVEYLCAGERLGARFSDDLRDSTGRVDWERVMIDESYKDSIKALTNLAQEGKLVAVVCSEGNPLTCHRFGLVSRSLADSGMEVKHVLTNGEVVRHRIMEDRMLEKYISKNAISSVMTGSYSEQIREAYRVMNGEYGYKQESKMQAKSIIRRRY